MAIKHIDKSNLKVIEQAILAKLRESLGTDFGLEFNFKGGNFTSGNAILKLEVAVKNPDGSIETRAAEDFKLHCAQFGFKPEHLGATFKVGRNTYKITGLVPKRYSMPVSAARVPDGRGFKFPAADVLTYLDAPVAPRRNTVAGLLANTGAVNHAEIEKRIIEMRRDNPEMYEADGEFRAAGLNDKQIHDHHYRQIEKQMRSGKTLPPMFPKK